MLRVHFPGFAVAMLLTAVIFSPVSRAQSAKAHVALKSRASAKSTLTPQQRQGLKILKSQAAVARTLSPVMRSFALLEIVRGYERLHDGKALSTLRDAFEASRNIEEEDDSSKEIKRSLQSQIVRELVLLDPAYCDRLIPQLSGTARKSAITELMKHFTRQKQFIPAIALLNQLGDEEFPYLPASQLMEALPTQMAGERQNLFAEALSSYSQREHKSRLGSSDFGVFVSRTWQDLPPGLVLQAIDEILKQARDNDTKMDITVDSSQGSASFRATYEYALFEVLPVLRELDSDRADQLLQEHRELQSTLNSFPNGYKSFDPKSGIPNSITTRSPNSSESAADDRYQDELQRRAEKIVGEANKNPKQALASVMSLPDFRDARLRALLGLATTISKTAPSYALQALSECLKLIPSVKDEFNQGQLLADVAQDYEKLGDTASMKEVVERGFKIAEKLYASDTDADDPNQAFKVGWPSTVMWGKFTALLARVSPSAAFEAISTIPDPEIQTLERIAVANGLIGTNADFQMVAVRTKSKNNYSVSVQ